MGDQECEPEPYLSVLALSLLSGLNAIALIANLTQPSRAAVGGMSYQDFCVDLSIDGSGNPGDAS